MAEIIQHLIKYTDGELKEILKNGEVFRKYPKNPKFALEDIRQYLGKITNEIEVSNLGHIKINGSIVSPFEKDKKGYFYVTLQDKIDYLVYRLVAETWCEFLLEDSNGWHIHHIVDDGSNNRADNLIWCEGQMHLNRIHK